MANLKKRYNCDHKTLVQRATNWLINTHHCRVVATEFRAGDRLEIPDVIGWTYRGRSILVECKASMSDLRRDHTKEARTSTGEDAFGVGEYRYYFIPQALRDQLKSDDIAQTWGLAIVSEHRVSITKQAPRLELGSENLRREKVMLVSMAARSLDAVSLVKPFQVSDVIPDDEDEEEAYIPEDEENESRWPIFEFISVEEDEPDEDELDNVPKLTPIYEACGLLEAKPKDNKTPESSSFFSRWENVIKKS